ncbi:hypothetical protein GGR53DRAFT_46194 [Hypoxylon sp. FL1150]|nr:hypothetical protein GGR53DRAFT_46194 [Hypoxylon sp. FL1150]
MVAPVLCSTGLGREAGTLTRAMHGVVRAMMAQTAEVGSRTILHGLVVGPEGHEKLYPGCKIKEYWMPDRVSNPEGQDLKKGIGKELAARLEEVPPGCISQLSKSECNRVLLQLSRHV